MIRIWAQDSDNRWFLLWKGEPQTVYSISRIFSPPLRPCDFKTRTLRLEFNHNLLECYTELDAVMLIGTSRLLIPKDPSHKQNFTELLKSSNRSYPCHEDRHNLTPDHETAHWDIYNLRGSLEYTCIVCKRYCNYQLSNIYSFLFS